MTRPSAGSLVGWCGSLVGWWLAGLADALLPAPGRWRGPVLRWGPAGLAATGTPGRRPARIELDPVLTLREERTWPAAAFRHLGPLMAARAALLWPVRGAAPVSGWDRRRDSADPGLATVLVLTRRETLDAAIAAAEAAGWTVGSVVPRGEPVIELLPPARRPAGPRRRAQALRIAAAALLAAALALPAAGLLALRADRDRAAAEAAAARRSADPAMAALSRLASLGEAVERLRARAEVRPTASSVIAGLAARLESLATLGALTLADGGLRLAGEAPDAAVIPGVLQGAWPGLVARFAGPVVRDPQTGAERFEIVIGRAGDGA
jgi:hypothetical protein